MGNFFNIAILGPRASGKTIFISSLFYSFINLNKEHAARFYLPAEEEKIRENLPEELQGGNINTEEFARKTWNSLFKEQSFGQIEGTFTNQNFHLFLESQDVDIVFYDIPGGWFQDSTRWQDEMRNIAIRMQKCDAAFLIVDSIKLEQDALEYFRDIQTFLGALTIVNREKKHPIPVAIIFAKCDDLSVRDKELDYLKEKTQAIVTNLQIRSDKKSNVLGQSIINFRSFECFKVSSIGELVDDKPPKGGPIQNELFENLQHSLEFLLTYRSKHKQALIKFFTRVGLACIVVLLLIYHAYSYYTTESKYSNLLTNKEEISKVERYSRMHSFSYGERFYLWNLLHGDLVEQWKLELKEKQAEVASAVWEKLYKKYNEPLGKISLSLDNYSQWLEEIKKYQVMFPNTNKVKLVDQQTTITNILINVQAKMSYLSCEDLQQNIQDSQEQDEQVNILFHIFTNLQAISTQAPELDKIVQNKEQELLDELKTIVANYLKQFQFPEEYIDEYSSILKKINGKYIPKHILALLEVPIDKYIKQNIADGEGFENNEKLFYLLKENLPLHKNIDKNTTVENWHKSIFIKYLWEQQLYDWKKKIMEYIQDEEITPQDKITVLEQHQKNYHSLFGPKIVTLDDQLQIKIDQKNIEIAKNIERFQTNWVENDWNTIHDYAEEYSDDYEGIVKRIQEIGIANPYLERFKAEEIKRLKAIAREKIVQNDYLHAQEEVRGYLSDAEYRNALNKWTAFIARWSDKIDRYPEAEKKINEIKSTIKKLTKEWKNYDYGIIRRQFSNASGIADLNECIELCNDFVKNHGTNEHVAKCKRHIERIVIRRSYDTILVDAYYATDEVGEIEVAVNADGGGGIKSNIVEGNKNFYWNKSFKVRWRAFDEVIVKIVDYDGVPNYDWTGTYSGKHSLGKALEKGSVNLNNDSDFKLTVNFDVSQLPELYEMPENCE